MSGVFVNGPLVWSWNASVYYLWGLVKLADTVMNKNHSKWDLMQLSVA